ncbi:MAG TPA: D-2-hydroxyacid dehydrogenase [Jatrophihabitans sp.]|nr:D-2-hydroxyacid dehydrogenase [Jatrophihabitans sp.]
MSDVAVAVVCADPHDQPPELAARLGGDADLTFVYDTDLLRQVLPSSDAVFVWDFQTTRLRDAWPERTQVRWVHVASAGVHPLLFPELRAQPVVLTNSSGVFDAAIAEFVLGAMLLFATDLPTTLRLQREHRWQHRERLRLAGSTVLVVGAGAIGRATARLASAAGCRAVGVARTGRDDPDFDRVVPIAAFDAELPNADYIAVTAPLTSDTAGLLGSAAFARTRPGAVLINVGRGPIVDDAALLAALDAGRLRGAVLDVFADEPLPPDHPYWDRPDVVVSPHMCGDFAGFGDVLVDLFLDNFRRWRVGDELRNVVDKDRGY